MYSTNISFQPFVSVEMSQPAMWMRKKNYSISNSFEVVCLKWKLLSQTISVTMKYSTKQPSNWCDGIENKRAIWTGMVEKLHEWIKIMEKVSLTEKCWQNIWCGFEFSSKITA